MGRWSYTEEYCEKHKISQNFIQARDEIGKMRIIHKGNVLYYETRMEYRIMTPEWKNRENFPPRVVMDLLVAMKKLRLGKTRTQNRNEGGAIPGPLVLNGESRYQPRIGALDVVYHSLDYFSAVAQFWRQRRQRGQTGRQRKWTL